MADFRVVFLQLNIFKTFISDIKYLLYSTKNQAKTVNVVKNAYFNSKEEQNLGQAANFDTAGQCDGRKQPVSSLYVRLI